MRKLVSAIAVCIGALVPITNIAHAEDALPTTQPPAKPKVYALVAAMGDRFEIVSQALNASSRLPPYGRKIAVAQNNVLNRFVLHALDNAIASTDANGRRVFLSLPSARMDQLKDYERGDAAIEQVIEFLRQIPDRSEWDSIVVATPAYKAFEINGMAGKIAGFGMFRQLLRSNLESVYGHGMGAYPGLPDFGELNGPETKTASGGVVRSDRYYAPFCYIEVWVIDPKTLAVVDRQKRFDNVKLWDPLKDITQEAVYKNFSNLVERSVLAAVTHSDILNKLPVVEVGDVKSAKPAAETK